MSNQLNHFALNSPAQGLNGWRTWAARAIRAIASAAGGPVGTLVASIILHYVGGEWAQMRLTISNTPNIPEDWNPTPQEEQELDRFVNRDAKGFFAYVNSVFDAIKNSKNYTEQLAHYNNLVKSYAIFTTYQKNNNNTGLSDYARLTKIEVVDIFMREIVNQLDAVFNIDANTFSTKRTENINATVTIGNLQLDVFNSFTVVYNIYEIKSNTVTTTDTVTGNTTTTSPDDTNSTVKPPLGNGSNPENPTTGKTYLWGWIDFDKKPYQSIVTTALIVLGVRKLIK
jgi:hypothetical protein